MLIEAIRLCSQQLQHIGCLLRLLLISAKHWHRLSLTCHHTRQDRFLLGLKVVDHLKLQCDKEELLRMTLLNMQHNQSELIFSESPKSSEHPTQVSYLTLIK